MGDTPQSARRGERPGHPRYPASGMGSRRRRGRLLGTAVGSRWEHSGGAHPSGPRPAPLRAGRRPRSRRTLARVLRPGVLPRRAHVPPFASRGCRRRRARGTPRRPRLAAHPQSCGDRAAWRMREEWGAALAGFDHGATPTGLASTRSAPTASKRWQARSGHAARGAWRGTASAPSPTTGRRSALRET